MNHKYQTRLKIQQIQMNANNKSDSDVRPLLLLGECVVVVLVVDIVVGAVVAAVVVGGIGNEGTIP